MSLSLEHDKLSSATSSKQPSPLPAGPTTEVPLSVGQVFIHLGQSQVVYAKLIKNQAKDTCLVHEMSSIIGSSPSWEIYIKPLLAPSCSNEIETPRLGFWGPNLRMGVFRRSSSIPSHIVHALNAMQAGSFIN